MEEPPEEKVRYMLHTTRDEHYAALIENAVLRLYDIGAILVDTAEGFQQRGHRLENSKLPKTPIYFNLRNQENPKPGNLVESDFDHLARVYLAHLRFHGVQFDAIAPIPNAGLPIARALQSRLLKDMGDIVPIIPLIKVNDAIQVDGDVLGRLHQGRRALLLDDTISSAGSKKSTINYLRSVAIEVTDCIVFFDREQGGRDALAEMDVRLLAPCTLRGVVEMGRIHRPDIITPEALPHILDYIEILRAATAERTMCPS